MSGKQLLGLGGVEKAAMLMLSIGEERAKSLFSLMADEEISRISEAMAGLKKLDPEQVESLFAEFSEGLVRTGNMRI